MTIQSNGFECTIAIGDGFNLLVPTNLIAETISGVGMQPAQLNLAWMIGESTWRGFPVPIVSLEHLLTGKHARLRGSHIAIFRGSVDTTVLPFYGVALQAVPHSYTIKTDAEFVEGNTGKTLNYVDHYVTLRGVSAVVPSISAIERILIGGLS